MTQSSTIMIALAVSVLAISLAACSIFQGQETTGQYVDDATITAKVKEAFIADKSVKASQINVETMQGVVQLSGFADAHYSEVKAVSLAEQVKGVKSVTDNIIVHSPSQ